MSGPKYCPDCGKELELSSTYCNYCGAKLVQYRIKRSKRKKIKLKSKTTMR